MPKLLENITYDSEGLVVGATSLMNVWLMQYNAGEKVEGQGGNSTENIDFKSPSIWAETIVGFHILMNQNRIYRDFESNRE